MDKQSIKKMYEEDIFSDLNVECPECACMEDDQYSCCTCDSQGGQGIIWVSNIIAELLKEK